MRDLNDVVDRLQCAAIAAEARWRFASSRGDVLDEDWQRGRAEGLKLAIKMINDLRRETHDAS